MSCVCAGCWEMGGRGAAHASCLVELLLEAAVVGEEGEAVRLGSVLAERVIPCPLNPAAAREGGVAGQAH